LHLARDGLERGIPRALWEAPVFATECNGYYFWKGGHPEDPAQTYIAGWVQSVLLEIDRWNHNEAVADGKVDISDAVNTLGVLFLGQGSIPLPGVDVCGVDPSEDEIDCGAHAACP
jgi:hypothetical protein